MALEDGDALMALFAAEKPTGGGELWRLRPVSVTPWRIRRLTSRAILWALAICWKVAATTA